MFTSKVISSRHFKTLFLIMNASSIALIVIFLTVYFNQKIQDYEEYLNNTTQTITTDIQATLQSVETTAAIISSTASVENLMSLENPSWVEYYSLVNGISSTLEFASFHSTSIFINEQQRVYVSKYGMSSYDEFFNQTLLNEVKEAEYTSKWFGFYDIRYPVSVSSVENVVSYIRKAPLYNQSRYGYVTIELPMEALQNIVKLVDVNPYINVTVDFISQNIYSSNEAYSDTPQLMSAMYTSPENELFVESSISYAVISHELLIILPYLILMIVILFAASFGISHLYSFFMIKPMNAILDNNINKITYNDSDEFHRLNTLFESLEVQLCENKAILEKNKPNVKERIIAEILTSNIKMNEPLDYNSLGIEFPYKRYSVVLFYIKDINTIDNFARRMRIKVLLAEKSCEIFSSLGNAYYAYTDDDIISILINSDSFCNHEQQLLDCCHKVSADIENVEIADRAFSNLTFSIVLCSKENPIPNKAWLQAKHNLLLADSSDIPVDYQSSTPSMVDRRLIRELNTAIINKNKTAICKIVNEVRTIHFNENSLEDQEKIIIRYMIETATMSLDMDVKVNTPLLATHLRSVTASTSSQGIIEVFSDYLCALICTSQSVSGDTMCYIERAAEYIKQNYSTNITVNQIAEHVNIHSVYLNKLFKITTGATLTEYVNSYRITQAKKLMTDTDETINSISTMVGYNDTRSFIRFFKKYNGVTPGEYRKNINRDV